MSSVSDSCPVFISLWHIYCLPGVGQVSVPSIENLSPHTEEFWSFKFSFYQLLIVWLCSLEYYRPEFPRMQTEIIIPAFYVVVRHSQVNTCKGTRTVISPQYVLCGRRSWWTKLLYVGPRYWGGWCVSAWLGWSFLGHFLWESKQELICYLYY